MRIAALLFLFALGLPLLVRAQEEADSIIVDAPPQKRFLPTGVRIGTDVISLIKSQRQEDFSGWEVNGDIDFHRYLLAVDYGQWARSYPDDTVSYSNDGRYWRMGIDVNFLKRDTVRNVFFLGFRYAQSRYSENMSVISEDPLWGVLDRDYANENLKARWFELTAGLKVRIWKIFWLGYTARFKFALKSDEKQDMLAHDIPGYGRTDKESTWGFNYQLMVKIPIRPSVPILPSPKKKKKGT